MTAIISESDKNYEWHSRERSHDNQSDFHELGYFGNIWVRSHVYKKAGDTNSRNGGHYHHFDHVTLLVKGSVQIDVEGHPSKTFVAPTFIVIKKDHKHKITALEDDTMYYCVFALRDVDGEVTDIYSGDNSPYSNIMDDVYEKMKKLDDSTTKK